MKYKYFILRSVNLILILLILGGYQFTLYLRAQQEEVKKLSARVEQLESEREDFLEHFSQDDAAKGLGAESEEKQESQERTSQEDGIYIDGSYEGTADGYNGPITVKVVVEGGKMSRIEILSAPGEDEAYLSIGKDIIPAIIKEQSADVDTISGATFSSTGIRNAVANAMGEMVKK